MTIYTTVLTKIAITLAIIPLALTPNPKSAHAESPSGISAIKNIAEMVANYNPLAPSNAEVPANTNEAEPSAERQQAIQWTVKGIEAENAGNQGVALEKYGQAIGDPSGLQLRQRGQQDDRARSMEEVRQCLDADDLDEALLHGTQAISLDKSNGYAYFAVGASIILYTPEDAEDAGPYLERAYMLFRIDGDVPGIRLLEEFLEGIKKL